MSKFDELKQVAQSAALAEEAQLQGWLARNKFTLIVGGLALLIGFILGKLF